MTNIHGNQTLFIERHGTAECYGTTCTAFGYIWSIQSVKVHFVALSHHLADDSFTLFSMDKKLKIYTRIIKSLQDNTPIDNNMSGPGTILKDRWELRKRIGSGGFGEIYEAKDLHTQKVSLLLYAIWPFVCTGHTNVRRFRLA